MRDIYRFKVWHNTRKEWITDDCVITPDGKCWECCNGELSDDVSDQVTVERDEQPEPMEAWCDECGTGVRVCGATRAGARRSKRNGHDMPRLSTQGGSYGGG